VSGGAEDMLGEAVLSRSSAVGTEALLSLLKNYCRTNEGNKTNIVVGVIGYPNTGKSSLINSLKCSNVVGTSAVAGFTKAMTEVVLDKNIRLLDSPGIVFDDSDSNATALRNCVAPEELKDPEGAIGEMLKRCAPEQLMALYALPAFKRGDADTFLSLVARRLNKMKKGGVADKAATAIAVLRDWNSGRVPYYANPPSDTAHLVQGGATIVSSFSAAFDPANMMQADAEVLETSTTYQPLSFVAFESGPAGSGSNFMESEGEEEDEKEEEEEEEEEVENEEEDEEEVMAKPVVRKSAKAAKQQQPIVSELATSSADARRQQKANLKKMKKSKRKGKEAMENGSDNDEEEAYNFASHY
jgi:nuclear GTP-binding protein